MLSSPPNAFGKQTFYKIVLISCFIHIMALAVMFGAERWFGSNSVSFSLKPARRISMVASRSRGSGTRSQGQPKGQQGGEGVAQKNGSVQNEGVQEASPQKVAEVPAPKESEKSALKQTEPKTVTPPKEETKKAEPKKAPSKKEMPKKVVPKEVVPQSAAQKKVSDKVSKKEKIKSEPVVPKKGKAEKVSDKKQDDTKVVDKKALAKSKEQQGKQSSKKDAPKDSGKSELAQKAQGSLNQVKSAAAPMAAHQEFAQVVIDTQGFGDGRGVGSGGSDSSGSPDEGGWSADGVVREFARHFTLPPGFDETEPFTLTFDIVDGKVVNVSPHGKESLVVYTAVKDALLKCTMPRKHGKKIAFLIT